MSSLIALMLALGLALALKKLRDHRRAVGALNSALVQRKPFLREDLPGTIGGEWDALCENTNAIVSELGQLQQLRTDQLAQLEATLGSLQEAVLIVDHNNYILLANRALQSIFPRARQILDQRLEFVLQSAAFLAFVESVRAGAALPRKEIEFLDGSNSIWVEATGTTIQPFGGRKGGPWALFVLHDISRQRKLENIRKEFVANVSHELRTPLSVIKGFVETLVDDHEQIPVADRDRFLKAIQRHTERLNSLLKDLLTLSRLESANPGLRREATDLPALLGSMVEDYRSRPVAVAHELQLHIEAGVPAVLVDPLKLSQVIENLLDNALKYTPRGSRIEVSVGRSRETEVEICVRDDGPGIPAEDLPHIFERFYRVDKGRSREKGGTGLGLSIVKHIVQLHGGRVWVESQLEHGTAFYLSLPVAPPAVMVSTDRPAQPGKHERA